MLRMPYGIKNAPSIFQKAMDNLLKGIPGVKCLLDDVLIVGKTQDEALVRIKSVLKIIAGAGLRLKQKKCKFMQSEVKYLGYILGKDGIKTNPDKVAPVLNASRPTNPKDVKCFLGAITYYCRFVKNLSKIAYPLNQLLKKNAKWVWSEECERSFCLIKEMLASTPILTLYDPNESHTIITDASPTGLGAVLVQGKREKPVIYVFRSLSESEKNYSQIEREGLCVVFAFERLRHFILGKQIKLVTDNKPLSSIVSSKLPALAASRIQRWLLKLAEYEYKVEVRRSEQIPVADWLSRLPQNVKKSKEDEVALCFSVMMDNMSILNDKAVARETSRDPILARVTEFVLNGWPDDVDSIYVPFHSRQAELTVEKGCLLWGLRVVIPKKLREAVLGELHVGHQGIVRMKQLARSYVWWPKIDMDLELLAKTCGGCFQKQKSPTKSALHPWEYPKAPWQRIHVDFAGPINGISYFVVIDSFSKWIEVFPMKTTTTDKVIKTLSSLFARFCLPNQLVSDNGPQFTSNEFKTFIKQNGVKHTLTAPYHPASNGAAERAVGILKSAMRAAKGSFDLYSFLLM